MTTHEEKSPYRCSAHLSDDSSAKSSYLVGLYRINLRIQTAPTASSIENDRPESTLRRVLMKRVDDSIEVVHLTLGYDSMGLAIHKFIYDRHIAFKH